MRRTRCCSTSRKAPAWRSRTRRRSAPRCAPHDIAAAFRTYQQARYLRTGRVQLTARFYGEIYHASGVMRELRNRMFQSGSEAAGFIGTNWLYQGIDPDRPFY